MFLHFESYYNDAIDKWHALSPPPYKLVIAYWLTWNYENVYQYIKY